jgi:mannonate dehydratase
MDHIEPARVASTLDRREVLGRISLGLAGGALAAPHAPAAEPPARQPAPAARPVRGRLKLGCQKRPTTAEGVQIWQRFGVTHVCGGPEPKNPKRGYWTVEELSKVRDLCEAGKLTLAMMWEPFLNSSHIDTVDRPAIMLGKSPDRDRDIECFQKHIENCAAVGVKTVKYNLSLLGVPRTARTAGRGGSSYSTWRLVDATKQAGARTSAGRVTADVYWERITYFLERIIPVAEQFKVRLACHPQDPGVPAEFQGVDAVLGTVEGLKRFVGIKESRYHGLNFCQGTISEMLEKPGEEIYEVIRWFGTRGKIFNVHFRNIRGRRDDFQEVYPDEGDVDMWKAVRTYQEVGYDGMLMYDHVPSAPGDTEAGRGFAYGYIRALIQAAES